MSVAALTTAGACDVCGSADPLGLGTCVPCGSPGSDTLLFLERSGRRADRRGVEAWLIDALGGVVDREAARDAAEGRRAVVRLPGNLAGRASGALSTRGVTATPVPRSRAWRKLPAGLVALASAILGAGLFAGLTVAPWIAALSAAFVALLSSAALRRLAEPLWTPEETRILGLPGAAERGVRATLNRLGPGRARTALADLATLSAGLADPADESFGGEVAGAVEELLELACDAAIDLEHLDTSLEVLVRRADAGPIDVPVAEAAARAAGTRARLVRRFEESLASLGRLQAAGVVPPARLSELAERLAADAEHRAEARETVRRLIA